MRRFFVAGAPRVRWRLEHAGWSTTARWDFDLYWRPQVPSLAAFASLRPGMRVNHLPGIGALTSSRLLPATLGEAGRSLLWNEPGCPDAARSASRFVLIAGVDPLRVHVHAVSGDAGGASVSPEIEAELRRVIVHSVLGARNGMTCAVRDLLVDRDACFELLRFDFRVGADGRVWLVRCALSPSLDTFPAIADDTLALLGIVPDATLRRPAADDLEAHWRELATAELRHAGGYVRLVPSAEPAAVLAELPLPRRSDLALAEQLSPGVTVDQRFVFGAVHAFLDGRLVLFCAGTQRFYVPNDTAAYVWLKLEDGLTFDAIAAELHRQFSVPLAKARCDVWDIVARWAHEGLLVRAQQTVATALSEPDDAAQGETAADDAAGDDAVADDAATVFLRVLDRIWRVELPANGEMRALLSPFAHLEAAGEAAGDRADAWITIAGDAAAGFRLRWSDGDPVECRDRAEVPPLVRRYLAAGARSRAKGILAIPGVAILPRSRPAARAERGCVILVGPESVGGAGIAALLLARGCSPIASGTVLLDEETAEPRALALGLEVSEIDDRDVSAALPYFSALPSWTLPSELVARYVPFAAGIEAGVEARGRGDRPFGAAYALVFVRRSPALESAAALRPVDSVSALQELMHHGMSSSPPMTDPSAERFLTWLEAIPCFELEMGGDLVSAADRVEALLEREHEGDDA